MIIVRLCGGLANQMFQYALGRHLSLRQQCVLKLDADALQNDPLGRRFRLHHFQIQADVCTLEDKIKLGLVRCRSLRALLRRAVDSVLPPDRRRYVRESSLNFDPRILRIGHGAYLDGYWPSRHYFEGIHDTIKADFRLRSPLSIEAVHLLNEIQAGCYVSVHVRRGDYASNPRTREFHGLLSAAYYARAFARLRRHLESPRFLVFSDDPAWCRTTFAGDRDISVSPMAGKLHEYEDFFLMSQCSHHIIANSTFSWWAAWLGENPQRIVVAPRNFRKSFSDLDRNDLYPPYWVLIDDV